MGGFVKLLETGIPILDEALGGGLIEDSNFLVVYDTYSNGWALAFEIMRNRMEMGDFGVIIDSVLPVTPLKMELRMLKFDVKKEGRAGNLAILDIFSSFHRLKYEEDYVYTDPTLDSATFLPKYLHLYRRILKERIRDRRPIGIDVTVDSLAFLLGEENTIKLFQNLMALKEKAKMEEKRKRPINIFLLNKGRASDRLVAWIALYSQYAVEFCSSSKSLWERMIIRKSPLPDFKPRENGYSFSLKKGSIIIQ